MFIKAVQNNRGRKGTYYCSLVEAYRENSKIKSEMGVRICGVVLIILGVVQFFI